MTNNTFHDRLRELIREFGQEKQNIFAEKVGIETSTLNHWFGRQSLPSGSQIMKFREHLGISVDWLLFGTGEKYVPKPGQVAEPRATYGGKVEHLTADEREYVEKLLHVLRTASPAKIGMITSQIELVLELTRMEAQRKDIA